MADLSRAITAATDALEEEKAEGGAPRGADGQPLATMAARTSRQQQATPQQQLLKQMSQLQQQVTQLQQQPAPQQPARQQPALSAAAIQEAVTTAISSSNQQPAEDPNSKQMQLTGAEEPQTMADKFVAERVRAAEAVAQVR